MPNFYPVSTRAAFSGSNMSSELAPVITLHHEVTRPSTLAPRSRRFHRGRSHGRPRYQPDNALADRGPRASETAPGYGLQTVRPKDDLGVHQRGTGSLIEDERPVYWRPTGFYWRRAIRTADEEGLRHIATALINELEAHKAFIREQGWIPPKDNVHPDEMRAKGWTVGEPISQPEELM